MSDLIDCLEVVEQLLSDGRSVAGVEEYIELGQRPADGDHPLDDFLTMDQVRHYGPLLCGGASPNHRTEYLRYLRRILLPISAPWTTLNCNARYEKSRNFRRNPTRLPAAHETLHLVGCKLGRTRVATERGLVVEPGRANEQDENTGWGFAT